MTLDAAAIDAADFVDDTGGIKHPLGQACHTGIQVRQNSLIQHSHCLSCPPDRVDQA